jgi:pantoate--beta-alanine ligase
MSNGGRYPIPGVDQPAGALRTLRTITDLRSALAEVRAEGRTIGLVPTMGALHDGHVSLLRRARSECDVVVMSLFVNPAQFAPGEDFEHYPRDEARDATIAEEAGVDLIFAPPAEEVYPAGFATKVRVGGVTDSLCGAPTSRGPEHFDGVATVVAKLFSICAPDVAYFGQKDYQQSLVIRRMAADLNLPVRVEVCPIVREPDGLALSSRNAYLGREPRRRAPALKRALDAAERAIAAGGTPAEAAATGRAVLAEADVEPEYLEVLRADDLAAPSGSPGERLVIAVAARVGPARLIDNCLLEVPESGARANGTDPVSGAVTTT